MWSSSSCRFRKYHGAFDGFGVALMLACSVSGALTKIESSVSSTRKTVAQTASTTTSDGQTITSSSARSVGRARARPRTSSSSFCRFASSIWVTGPAPLWLVANLSHLCVTSISAIRIDYSGPEIPPSLRIRQKWTAIKKAAASGRKMTCSV